MELERLEAQWDSLGADDPYWAILSDPRKRGNRWDVEEFFATGREHVSAILARAGSFGIAIERGRALDFGCGAGRLSQALAEHFETVDGVDIASSMIELANAANRRGEGCHYHQNAEPDLRLFDDATFDFVLSHIVLQHIEPRFAERYIREFVRVLKPGGVLVFQIPSEPAPTAKGLILRLLNLPILRPLLNVYRRHRDACRQPPEMYGIRKARIVEILGECGATLREAIEDRAGGRTWVSFEYWASRATAGAERLELAATSSAD